MVTNRQFPSNDFNNLQRKKGNTGQTCDGAGGRLANSEIIREYPDVIVLSTGKRRGKRMDWRLKAVAFWVFQFMPLGDQVHYWAQRHVTKTLPRRAYPLDLDVESQQVVHVEP